jgi:hypothetical protein
MPGLIANHEGNGVGGTVLAMLRKSSRSEIASARIDPGCACRAVAIQRQRANRPRCDGKLADGNLHASAV